jgi:ABC-type molybdenum transport system ATPase subunit/photorepair protein PhrA
MPYYFYNTQKSRRQDIMAILELTGIGKRYGLKSVLSDVSHRFSPGLTLLTGPSGAGKSTLLRLIGPARAGSTGMARRCPAPAPRCAPHSAMPPKPSICRRI